MHVSSYYAATARPGPVHPPLTGEMEADVCVVGAGLTGCTAALELAERGYRVAVVEARRIGWGASGRSGGQKIAGYGCDMGRLRRLVGAEDARRLWDMSVEAVEDIEARIRRYHIACDHAPGHVTVALKPRQVRELQALQRGLEEDYGYTGLRLLTGEALKGVVNSRRYLAGLYDPRGGHLHPLNYTLGLAGAAGAAGARFFEASPVTRIERGRPAVVHTPRGRVRAGQVLLCANAYVDGLERELARRMVPVVSYMVATEPLGEARARALLPTNAAVADMNHLVDYYRLSADHRLLFGGRLPSARLRGPAQAEAVRARMAAVFPALRGARIDYAWGGHVAVTRNRAPQLGRLAPNVYFAQGYSGHGIALTGLAGKLMAEAIAADSERFDVFTRIPHLTLPAGAWFRRPAVGLALAWYRLRDLLP